VLSDIDYFSSIELDSVCIAVICGIWRCAKHCFLRCPTLSAVDMRSMFCFLALYSCHFWLVGYQCFTTFMFCLYIGWDAYTYNWK